MKNKCLLEEIKSSKKDCLFYEFGECKSKTVRKDCKRIKKHRDDDDAKKVCNIMNKAIILGNEFAKDLVDKIKIPTLELDFTDALKHFIDKYLKEHRDEKSCSILIKSPVLGSAFSDIFKHTINKALKNSKEKYITIDTIKYELINNEYYELFECLNKDIKKAIIPKNIEGYPVTSIGAYAFYNCTSLKNIIIPDNVTSIGKSTFENCTGLTSITLPPGVTSIGSDAFWNCEKLKHIEFNGFIPPTINKNTFDNIPKDCIVYIPENSTGYDTENWKKLNIKQIDENYNNKTSTY